MASKFEIGTALAVLTTVFVIGAGWSSFNGRLDRIDEKLAAIEKNNAEPLCLTVLTTQDRAVESGKSKVKDELKRLSEQFCPQPQGNIKLANYTSALSDAERARQISKSNDELARIIAELDKPL